MIIANENTKNPVYWAEVFENPKAIYSARVMRYIVADRVFLAIHREKAIEYSNKLNQAIDSK